MKVDTEGLRKAGDEMAVQLHHTIRILQETEMIRKWAAQYVSLKDVERCLVQWENQLKIDCKGQVMMGMALEQIISFYEKNETRVEEYAEHLDGCVKFHKLEWLSIPDTCYELIEEVGGIRI